MKRFFLQKAHVYNPTKHWPGGFLMSEKLDGIRCFWDGGFTRGMKKSAVPFANTAKDYINKEEHFSTGLWSQLGNVIHAPDWFLDSLPRHTLDGELYTKRQDFETITSITLAHASSRWDQVHYHVYDIPPPAVVFSPGAVAFGANYKKTFPVFDLQPQTCPKNAEGVYNFLSKHYADHKVIIIAEQEMLHYNSKAARSRIDEKLSEVTDNGGEGLMLRSPLSTWTPERVYTLLKVKREQDAEGTVIGYTWGRATDKGSKLLGLMGALKLSYNGKVFELSGFTDAERIMTYRSTGINACGVGRLCPGEVVIEDIHNPLFPVGSQITFSYSRLTDAGIPKEARFKRRRSDLD